MTTSPRPDGGPTLHLHIGLPKTASTWLQERVFPSLGHLRYRAMPRSTLFDAPEDIAAESRLLNCAFRRSPHVWREAGDDIFAALFGPASAAREDGRDALVSEEGIGRTGSRPELLAAHLSALSEKAAVWGFDRINVVCVIRRQDEWLASHYAQMSDRRRHASQADFADRVNDTLDASRSRFTFGMLLDYDALFRSINGAPGQIGIAILPYEALAESPAEFMEAMVTSLGAPGCTPDLLDLACSSRVNARSAGARWRLRPRRVALSGRSVAVPHWMQSPGRRRGIELTPELSRRIMAGYADSNRRLAEVTGLPLGRYGYF